MSDVCLIEAFIHCKQCLDERPGGVSPRDWAQLEVGFTHEGIQVWCKRHEREVAHLRAKPGTVLLDPTKGKHDA